MKRSNYLLWLSAVCTLTFSSAWAQTSDVLLLIDDADPAAIIVTATTNDPIASNNSHVFSEGVDLAGFFTSPVASGSEFPQTSLTTYVDGAPPVYGADASDNLNDPGASTGVDLRLYTPETNITEPFAAGMPAFSGTATFVVFGDAISSLPVPGTVGDIYAGYAGDEEDNSETSATTPQYPGLTLIGEYAVVPEPGSGLLLLLAGVALLAVHRVRLAR